MWHSCMPAMKLVLNDELQTQHLCALAWAGVGMHLWPTVQWRVQSDSIAHYTNSVSLRGEEALFIVNAIIII
jgi:hypothetical protein